MPNPQMSGHVKSGMEACARAVRRCIHFPLVLKGSPSSHPTGRCLAIPISLRCWSTCCNHEARSRPNSRLHSRDSLTERIWWAGLASEKKKLAMCHTAAADAHKHYRFKKYHLNLSQQTLVGYKVWPAIVKDSPKKAITEGVKSPSQILRQRSSLTSIEQD